MATYYVDPVAGLDNQTGAQGDAKQTLKGFATAPAITLVDDDVIVLVNSGAHELPLQANEYSITKRVTIRGGTAAGANAETTISSTSDTTARRYVEAAAGGEITFENIKFDFTATHADTDAYDVLRYNGATAKQRFRGCSFLAKAMGVGGSVSGARRIFNQVSNPGTGVDTIEFYRCYFQNAGAFVTLNGVTDTFFSECVLIGDLASLNWITKALAAGTGGQLQFTKSTVYVDSGTSALGAILTFNHNGTTAGATVTDNLVFLESSNASPLVNLMRDSSGPNAVTGTRDYNVLLGGPSVAAADLYSPGGWFENSWDYNQDDALAPDTNPNDQVVYLQAAATIFRDPSSSYAWSTVNSLTITLPKDLRPLLYLSASSTGGVVGALPAAQTDYAVSITTDNTAPNPGDSLTITVTYSNTGNDATGCVVSAAIPTGLTLDSATPSQGSYAAGVWTVGSMTSGSSVTLALAVTVDADQAGNSIVFTASHTSGDPASDTDPSNDSASKTFSVTLDPENDPGETPYLDVAPIYAPVLLAEINAIVRTSRNKITQYELRRDFEGRTWREFTGRYYTLAPSTTVTVVSSIERVDFLIMEATGDVEVSASSGDTDFYFPAATRLSVLDGDFTTLKLRNPSATESVGVLIVVID